MRGPDEQGRAPDVTSRASARVGRGPGPWVGASVRASVQRIALVAGLLATTACGAEPVEARAIWVDDFGGEGHRRVHVYDRGSLSEFEVLGASEPVERVELDPRGQGVLVRAGERRGAWFDLDDGRRLPLLLPLTVVGGESPIRFADQALTWIDDFDHALVVVPLAPGLALERGEDGTVTPIRRVLGSGSSWSLAGSHAPIVFVAGVVVGTGDGGEASFVRYPTEVDDPLGITLEATAGGLSLPATPAASHRCNVALSCFATVAVAPEAELAIFAETPAGPWQLFDRRAPELAGPLVLAPALAEAQSGPGLRLLAVLDRAVSVWIGAGQLHHYDRLSATVTSLPLFAVPPLSWTTADRGRAVILSSSSGPVYRADLTGVRAISLETTVCPGSGQAVVSPNGRWVAWTCIDADAEVLAASGVVVRVSSGGLERFVGIPMSTLAIDDQGDLLLYSVESSFADEVDGVGPTTLPRNLFSLSGDGVLTRVDELEPAPTPVLVGTGELASYIQGVALE